MDEAGVRRLCQGEGGAVEKSWVGGRREATAVSDVYTNRYTPLMLTIPCVSCVS